MPDRAITRRARLAALALLSLATVAALTGAGAAEPSFPALTGRVVDGANLLSPDQRQAIAADLQALEERSTDQLVIVTLPSLQGYEIEDFGYRLGRHWGIGQAGKDNGVLLIVAPGERKVRIEVGRGLEGDLPDAMARLIVENAILPRFRAKDFHGGIVAGVRDITDVLTGDVEAVRLRADKPAGVASEAIIALVVFAIWILIFIFVVWSIVRSVRQGVKGGKGKKSSGWVFGSGNSSGSGRSGGGGFSGGGGSFGGGGASGGW